VSKFKTKFDKNQLVTTDAATVYKSITAAQSTFKSMTLNNKFTNNIDDKKISSILSNLLNGITHLRKAHDEHKKKLKAAGKTTLGDEMQHIKFTSNDRVDVKVETIVDSHSMFTSASKECVDDVVGQIVELNALDQTVTIEYHYNGHPHKDTVDIKKLCKDVTHGHCKQGTVIK